MPESAYDLLVLLDPEIPDERRAQILDTIKEQIDSGGGTLKGDADWGMRKLAYEIDNRQQAHYHLFQLEAGGDLLNQLDRSMTIEDAILRHRIIRIPRGAPDAPPRPAPAPSEREPSPETAQEPARQEGDASQAGE